MLSSAQGNNCTTSNLSFFVGLAYLTNRTKKEKWTRPSMHASHLVDTDEPVRQLEHVVAQADDDELRVLGALLHGPFRKLFSEAWLDGDW